MFSRYNRESYMLHDFLQTMVVRELEEKKHLIDREKILRDLHDGLGGITTNIHLLTEMCRGASSPDEVRRTLDAILDLANEGLTEIKGFLTSMDRARSPGTHSRPSSAHGVTPCFRRTAFTSRTSSSIREQRPYQSGRAWAETGSF
jgi:signal transduction histidine kinase